MKLATATVLLASLVALPNAQQGESNKIAFAHPGRSIGEKAPLFVAKDQFGQEQSNETLKGTKGTILLFFRSADW